MPEPIHLRWVDELPPRADRAPTMRHHIVAEALRQRPGCWAMLPDFEPNWSSAIRSGSNAAYRPGGSFEAVARQGRLYARYVGGDGGTPNAQ